MVFNELMDSSISPSSLYGFAWLLSGLVWSSNFNKASQQVRNKIIFTPNIYIMNELIMWIICELVDPTNIIKELFVIASNLTICFSYSIRLPYIITIMNFFKIAM